MTALEKINKELFTSKYLVLENNLQGQYIDASTIIHVGDRFGTKYHDASAVLHELAHFVEININRIHLNSWGLHIPKILVSDIRCTHCTTHQCTDRELRVHAYQSNLMQYFKLEEDVDAVIRALSLLPDARLVPIEDGSDPYCDDRLNKLSHSEIKQSQHKWRIKKLIQYKKEFTLDRFFSEYRNRLQKLEPRC